MKAICNNYAQTFQRGVCIETYNNICSKMGTYRFDPDLLKAKHQILGFVQGLRFSALLIYSIRKILKQTNLTASWGIIMDEKPSRECDIIIYKKDKETQTWNGGEDLKTGPVMDFRFIPRSEVKLVISCKSDLTNIDSKMKQYAKEIKKFVNHLWLFAECCERKKVGNIRRKSRDVGYEQFWFLYSSNKSTPTDQKRWEKFTDHLVRLVTTDMSGAQ